MQLQGLAVLKSKGPASRLEGQVRVGVLFWQAEAQGFCVAALRQNSFFGKPETLLLSL